MSTRLTYTSGALGSDTDREFEQQLSAARAETPQPLPHLVAGEERVEGEPFDRIDPTTDDAVASRGARGAARARDRGGDRGSLGGPVLARHPIRRPL